MSIPDELAIVASDENTRIDLRAPVGRLWSKPSTRTRPRHRTHFIIPSHGGYLNSIRGDHSHRSAAL